MNRIPSTAARVACFLFALLILCQVLYPQAPAAWNIRLTALTVFLFLGASVAASWHRSGPRFALSLAGLAFLVGLASEILGVHTGFPFSTYWYTDALQPQLFEVPILIPLAWAMMAYPAWRIGELLGNRPVTRALFAAAALTAWDVALDPQMVGQGFWIWPNGGQYAGIPLINFVGWFAVGAVLFGWWALGARAPSRPSRWCLTDLLGPLLFAWTWIGETVAHALFFAGWAVAIASFIAMGLLTVPALLRQWTGSATA